jgi:molybdopterin molybdotransferase
MADMVTYEQAITAILEHSRTLGTETRDILDARYFVLARDIFATREVPLFDNSAMDGYAVINTDIENASENSPVKLKIIDEVPCGVISKKELNTGQAIKIMTGAPIPKNASSVVMQEYTKEEKNFVYIYKSTKTGENIRLCGEDIKNGELILSMGSVLNSEEIGVLASLGIGRVNVYTHPKIAIIVNGDELSELYEENTHDKIFTSNSYTLCAMIKELNAYPVYMGIAKDNLQDIKEKIKNSLNADIIITSAGVSFGKYDFVRRAMEEIGVKFLFNEIAIKPGKPTSFGILNNKMFFGLPGNPVSTMIIFSEFVKPAILKIMGYEKIFDEIFKAKTCEEIKKKPDRMHFLRGIAEKENNDFHVKCFKEQGSGILTSMSKANCLLIIPRDKEYVGKNEEVDIKFFNYCKMFKTKRNKLC